MAFLDRGSRDKFKEMLSKGMSLPLKAIPLWMEAIGVGVFISTIVDSHPGFKERLAGLEGKVFRFEATDIGKSFYLQIKNRDIRVLPHMDRPPDVIMRGEVKTLTEVLLGKVDPDTVFFSRKLEINGDTAAAIHFKNILAALS